jgi:hypothetical protein
MNAHSGDTVDYDTLTRRLKMLQRTLTILTVARQPKTAKSLDAGVVTAVIHLLPATEYDAARVRLGLKPLGVNLCPFAGECRNPCLNTAGRGGIAMDSYHGSAFLNNVQKGRYRRTDLYFSDRAAFERAVLADLDKVARFAGKHGYQLGIRWNGTSDIDYETEHPALVSHADGLGFEQYDYTKRPIAYDPSRTVRRVYSLDRGAARDRHALRYLRDGGTVAVVFAVKPGRDLPTEWNGYPVVDGDLTDLRSRDPRGVVVGLRAKGHARSLPVGGFVRAA